MSPAQLIVWHTIKAATCFYKLCGHLQAAHAHKTKIAIDNLEEVVEINKFNFLPMPYNTEPWMVLRLLIKDTAIEK